MFKHILTTEPQIRQLVFASQMSDGWLLFWVKKSDMWSLFGKESIHYTSQKTHRFQLMMCTVRYSQVHLALFILFVLWEYKGEQDSGEPVGCDEQK